jgi:EAL domain-containing protein (putative c-di-GMP-specific phosphodiesterase class I)
MTETGENAEIVRTIVTLAHNLGLQVIAEGVETLDQLEKLKLAGCEYGQGYLFSKPVSEDTISAQLADELRRDRSTFEKKLLSDEELVYSPYQM